jgi:hypothetical protein
MITDFLLTPALTVVFFSSFFFFRKPYYPESDVQRTKGQYAHATTANNTAADTTLTL